MTDNATRNAVAGAMGVYGISVAAELSGIGVQTLRLYERRGLITPTRTDGGTRRYSTDDLERIRRIGQLVADGINIAGIAVILDLQDHISALSTDNAALRAVTVRSRRRPRNQGE